MFIIQNMIEKRKKGKHLENKETKASIIEFILENKEKVSEPAIRGRLKEKHNVIDQGTINKHLHSLWKELKCIERVPPIKQGIKSYWNITNIENLKNVKHEFPEILLNSYEKSIMIIFNERGYDIRKIENLDFYIELLLSVSLFDAFLGADVYELMGKSKKIYLRDGGDIKTKNYKYHLDNFLKMSEEVNPGYKISPFFEINRRHMSKEVFFKSFEGFQIKTDEMIKELEEAYKIYKEIDEDLDNKPGKILLEHFINHDIYKDLESPDEIKFFTDFKECRRKAFNIWQEEDPNFKNFDRYIELIHLEELKVNSEIIQKYKQPSMFYISENPDLIYDELKEAYKDQI
ncbi:hypothetical protein DU86_08610 [Methanosarcina mazei]|uniref:Uncharacterized protein n=2 Tax=Methanosarcina mazei TaxID=2209 RepID=A0A0F8V9R9_METMZ|nr:hypothetical protein DU31_07920 [Methanosarcina mazei]KKH39392.1 hypothetical protein DU50_06815 [Methanosarcina mazei]KKH51307.1 hypothetical protein DU85_09010 [Methanosarcina mazei]KKH53125.1 hypothetical protein DU76_10735 [Methanosarcina mazei]KKH68878.1 hypothetical protein DU75_08680 [Methanosarcina mazei]